jgi:hypothetical protein
MLQRLADQPSLPISDGVQGLDRLGLRPALNCIVRPVRWMRGGRRVGTAGIGLASRLGKRDASAIPRTSSAGTESDPGIAFGAKPETSSASSLSKMEARSFVMPPLRSQSRI